ncbi:sodium-dependent proline transporter-like isoform X1 [Dermacentor silvarum]|uniref:sodium-dependent proline transporter-like isoform X1 n=1 Tax=Dermacentor silvarum TaxID=543639 RepID=UPI001898C60A|nr:sodium-dependent proline transporter-like isoform X1 [Dermacentor silvarum]
MQNGSYTSLNKTADGDGRRKSSASAGSDDTRGKFGSRIESLLYCIGFAVGIGDVWRFPILVYQNGGGAFFAAYVIVMILVAIPLFTMELALGQFSSLGPIAVWKCLPVAQGIGVAMVVMSLLVAIYYNVILCYTLYYLAQSFRSVLPWADCYEWWGADPETCYVRYDNHTKCRDVPEVLWRTYGGSSSSNMSSISTELFPSSDVVWLTSAVHGANFSVPVEAFQTIMANCSNATQTAAEQFWEKYVLDLSPNIEAVGGIKWDLCLCLFVSWLIVFLCLIRGVSSSGKVVYFTATFPYVVLFILLVKGVTLSGSGQGIAYFLVPDFTKLTDLNIWRRATEQVFYSLAISWGGLIMSGSYNPFRYAIQIDASIVVVADLITSLLGGIAIFAVLGHMSLELQVPIEEVAKAGQGLAFVIYPEALTTFWCPQLWSFIFFFMLYLLGIDSEFPLLQTTLTVLSDTFPVLRKYRSLTALIACTTCFIIGLTCVTQGGQYVLNLLDTYCAGVSALFIAMCEVMALMWLYGVRRFSNDIKFMLGKSPPWIFRFSWAFLSPLILCVLVVYGLAMAAPVMYNNVEPYPAWANRVGWFLASLSMIQIPLWAGVALFRARKNIRSAFEPTDTWGPAEKKLLQEYRATVANTKDRTCNVALRTVSANGTAA